MHLPCSPQQMSLWYLHSPILGQATTISLPNYCRSLRTSVFLFILVSFKCILRTEARVILLKCNPCHPSAQNLLWVFHLTGLASYSLLLRLYTPYIPSQLQWHCLMTILEHTHLAPASESLHILLFISESFFPQVCTWLTTQAKELRSKHTFLGESSMISFYTWSPAAAIPTPLLCFIVSYHLPPPNILPSEFCLLSITFHSEYSF